MNHFFHIAVKAKPLLQSLLTALVLLAGVPSCQRNSGSTGSARNLAMVMALEDADQPQTALVWTRDGNGAYQTYLLGGNKNQSTAIATHPSLLLATDTGIFEITSQTEEIVLCDCSERDTTSEASECPAGIESAPRQQLILSKMATASTNAVDNGNNDNNTSGETVDLFPLEISEMDMESLVALDEKAVVTGTIGPYVFIRYDRAFQLCGDEQITETHGYSVFNISSMQFESPLTDDEMSQIGDAEQQMAYETIQNSTGFSHLRADDLTLTGIRPVFVNGLGFSLEYEFEAQSQMDKTQNNWRDYTRQISIQARKIPDELAPFALAPPLVRTLIPSESVSIGGWSLMSGMPEPVQTEIAALFAAEKDAATPLSLSKEE